MISPLLSLRPARVSSYNAAPPAFTAPLYFSKRQPVTFAGGADSLQRSSRTRNAYHLTQLLKLQTHAQKAARFVPNYSGRHYGALVVLADGTEGMSANVEASRQVTLCDLRLALSQAQNCWIAKQKDDGSVQGGLPKVKTIYLVNADPQGEQPIPCADCQEWLASPLCPPDVSVVSLEKDSAKSDQTYIRTRTVKEMLPLYRRLGTVFTAQMPIAQLPVQFSPSIGQKLESPETSVSQATARKMLTQAKQAYEADSPLAKDSALATGVSVLLAPSGLMVQGGRLDWSTRWHEPADLIAATGGFFWINQLNQMVQKTGVNDWLPRDMRNYLQKYLLPQTIQAVAYYGNDPQLPPIASLGRMARKRGSAETVIITPEQNQIQVRTIQDFLPELYRAHSQ